MLDFQNAILRLIARGASIEETLDELCTGLERLLPRVTCTVLSVDRAGLLRSLSAPSLPPSFAAAMEGIMIGPGTGSCGTAVYTREPIAIPDLANDARWVRYKDLPLSLGLRACWSSPITREDGAPIGALACYCREAREPADEEQAIIAAGVELCELALRRHRRVLDRERKANVDALTGLPNRAAFDQALRNLPCDQPGAWAVLVIDLDNLKGINDTFGHQSGDRLIHATASRIGNTSAPDVSFRIGGDEFAVVIQGHEALADLEGTASRLMEALAVPLDCEGHSVVPAATIGCAVVAPGDSNAQTVYRNADWALYHAKESGRGGFARYCSSLGTRLTHRRDAIRELAAALDEGRIVAHYQPLVRLETRTIVGLEALYRVRSPEGELLAAQQFREATSDPRVATTLTSTMLAIVAGDVRQWIDEGVPFERVGINVSAADLYAGDLSAKLERTFGNVGVALRNLVIEVSESICFDHRANVVRREISRLRRSGAAVSLDDFGTSHASLTHLLQIPSDHIKIDRSFIAGLGPDGPSAAIVRGLIDIARNLDMAVVAEGVETEEQVEQLTAMGCLYGQGFAFSKAVDAVTAANLLRAHSHRAPNAIPLDALTAPRVSELADATVASRTGTT